MKSYEIELKNGEIIKFRLTSGEAINMEEKTKTKLLDYIQDYSITNIVTTLMYLRRFEMPNFSKKEATVLFDKLVDDGYTLEQIVYDVIYEAMVASGFLKKEELEEIKQTVRETQAYVKKQREEALEN